MVLKLFIFLCINISIIYCSLSELQFASLSDENTELLWNAFKKEYNKAYNEEEDAKRKAIFVDNMKEIKMNNYLFGLNHKSYESGINEYADMEWEEFDKQMNGFVYDSSENDNDAAFYEPLPTDDLPAAVDHRDKGLVNPVENQKACGSCWAFSTAGALEGLHALKTGNLVSLSKQQLVDCNRVNRGCGGGWMNKAFDYIISNDGVNTGQSYPYIAHRQKCRYNATDYKATMSSYEIIPRGDENALKSAVALHGPVAVAINARRHFKSYKSGVYKAGCSTTRLNHAVLVVGYGTDAKAGDYWIVKNSWGTTWGEDGYIRMARNNRNMCGIASYASFPKV